MGHTRGNDMLPFLSLGLLYRIFIYLRQNPRFFSDGPPEVTIETIGSQVAAETSTHALHIYFEYIVRLWYACDVEFVLPRPTFVYYQLAQIPIFSLRLASGSNSGRLWEPSSCWNLRPSLARLLWCIPKVTICFCYWVWTHKVDLYMPQVRRESQKIGAIAPQE